MLNIKLPVVIVLLVSAMCWQVAQAQQAAPAPVGTEKNYFRIENSTVYEETDPKITSVGVLGFDKDMVGHMDLTYIESIKDGKGLTLDAGAGYGFNWYVSMYLGLGIGLGYNWDNDEVIATYYPEAGVVIDITKSFGLTISKKRYFKLYGETEDVIMLGLVFR